jgi:glycosyltransferase involved in cell wall biosynthesis
MPRRNILCLVLTSFSSTGGIEKFNRAFFKALNEIGDDLSIKWFAAGMYDHTCDEKYVTKEKFQPFYGNRGWFIFRNMVRSFSADELILGHINLSVIGILFKWIRPSKKLTMICHGIEVFDKVKGIQKKALQAADCILAVSTFTKQQLITVQGLPAEKIVIFQNTLDPFFKLPASFNKPVYLKERYQIGNNEKVLFTLTRLRNNEGYKGYDKVIRLMPHLISNNYQIKYILAGSADEKEYQAVRQLIKQLQLEKHIVLTGFITEEEVTDHYQLADVFVMPSKGEGFGIVYLEAMACGLPVIAGNKDGSTEALQFGELGTLVNPDSEEELQTAIQNVLKEEKKPQQIQQDMLQKFSFDQYKIRLKKLLQS